MILYYYRMKEKKGKKKKKKKKKRKKGRSIKSIKKTRRKINLRNILQRYQVIYWETLC